MNALPIFFRVREMWNGWLFVLTAFAIVLLVPVIARMVRQERGVALPTLGILLMVIGECGRSGWSWVLFKVLNDFGDRSPQYVALVSMWWISGTAVLTVVAGLLISIYALSPDEWAARNVGISVALVTVFSVLTWNFRLPWFF